MGDEKAGVLGRHPSTVSKPGSDRVSVFPNATIECKSLADNGDKIRRYEVVYFMASTDTIEENTKAWNDL